MSEIDKLVHIVDDDDSVRRSVSFLLKKSGYKVKPYASGCQLMRDSRELDSGCILLDIRMPDMDGLEVQQALKDKGVTLPIIIMTGHADVPLSVQAMKAGAIEFLEKPFEKRLLLEAVEASFVSLDRAESRRKFAKDASIRLQKLTLRERQVLQGLADGLPNKTIAYNLGISPRTVEIHRANLISKLGARGLSDVLRLAFAAQDS